jgi:hypothetical protein
VLTFGNHSLAGYFFYVLFYVNLQTWRLKRRKMFLVFALCYLVMIFSLLSVTGIVFGMLAILQLFYYLWLRNRKLAMATVLAFCLGLPLCFQLLVPSTATWHDVIYAIADVVTSSEHGLLGRFGPGGTISSYDLQYLWNHPLSPVGVSYMDQLFFGDSAPIEYILRGSVILLFLVYGGLYSFLHRNLLDRSDAYLLFAVTVAFELGWTTLTNYRALYLIPFFVVYLNGLRRSDDQNQKTMLPA